MAIRTLTFNATPNGITPANFQKAGVQGEHNATRVIITLSAELLVAVGASNAVYRYEFVDGMGQFDTTENFLATDIDSLGVIDLPNGWTSAGGRAELRLVIAQLDVDNNEELILYSFPCRLLFEGRSTGTGTTQANLETGLSGLIAETVESASNADVAAANANNVAGGVQAAEDLRVTAETNRVDAESGRASAEGLRVTAETGRASAESGRASAEGLRSTAETGRASAESSRVTSENGRANAENIRNTSEVRRNNAENARNTAEGTRQQNETARIAAEDLREQGEVARQTAYGEAETARDGLYNTAELSRNSEYDNAEAARQSLYSTAEDARDSNYDATETARNNSYGAAEAGRDSQYDTAETQRNTDYNSAELVRDGLYGTAEQDRDSIFQTAETARQAGYDEFDGRIVDIETTKASTAALSETNLRIATIDKTLTDYQNAIASINPNQEAKQTASGYGTVSLPANASNGQVSVSLKGETRTNLAKINSIVGTYPGGNISTETLQLSAGKTYTLSVYINAKESTNIEGKYNIRIGNTTPTYFAGNQIAGATNGVSKITFIAPTNDVYTIALQTNLIGSAAIGTVYYTQILLEEIDIVNPFITGTNSTISGGRLVSKNADETEKSYQYYPDCGLLRSVGSAKDEVSFNEQTKQWGWIRRNQPYALQASDMTALVTTLANVDTVQIKKPIDSIAYGNTTHPGSISMPPYGEFTTAIDSVANIGKIILVYSGINYHLVIAKGTYANLAAAQAALTGTKLTYQLASPVVTPIDVTGTLIAHPNGTVYWESVLPVAGVYTSTGIAITNTSFPIESLESISKIDFVTGVETPIDVSKAVINADGLSFTHPDLIDGDIVFFTYFHGIEGTQPKIDVEYYDSRYTVKDTVIANKFYQWTVTVANGVASLTLVEV